MMGENSKCIQCQTCFAAFDTIQNLRDHVGEYQREAHALMARLREILAHLPPLDKQRPPSHGNLDEGDRDLGADDGEDTDKDDSADLDGLFCPYPACDRGQAFQTKQAQIRHYETHIPCYEICVFCRYSFVQARKYIAHNCKAKPTSHDQWRDQYRKERCAQLHQQAAEKLDEMLDLDKKALRKEDFRKRARDAEDQCADQRQAQKRSRTTHGTSNGLEVRGQSSLFASMRPLTPPSTISSQLDSCVAPTAPFPNGVTSSGTDFSFLEEPFTLLPGRIQAPIFHSATIPPWYGLEQQLRLEPYESALHISQPSSGDCCNGASLT
ncbi:uncharacterized protein BDZ83DRAFT_408407 [Colletotrichum acutatum]|uniref:Uncharacterized protein n=1 Tax=Glomerella acutata TaxID=27357 RepID=A0AAD8UJK0_GLOAC|nr:uncharacterized protein BDZ83DRAFT_408407 [Colletotrichum acutatum]KAK1722915.1 hypothetical protein BDZ83DRAFT_408407 [Colletotrichum acutatum]